MDNIGTGPVHLILIQDVVYFEGKIILPYIEELMLPWNPELLGSEVCWVPVASGQVP